MASLTKPLEKNDMLVVAQEFLGDGMEEDRKSLIKLLKVCLYQRVGAGTHQRQLNAGDHKNTKPNSVALCSWMSLNRDITGEV